MKPSLAITAIIAAVASANPFAPKKSANNAQSAYYSKLLNGAKVVRSLEEEEFKVDISSYSLKFEKCQFVKSYDDELAEDEDSATVLSTKRFVVFRLCPYSCSSCSTGYGEYIVDLETYLEASVEYQQEVQQEMCNACQECGNWDDQVADEDEADEDEADEDEADEDEADEDEADEDEADEDEADEDDADRKLQQYSVDCNSCYEECMKIENMEENGYIDATQFLECQMIYDAEDDGKSALYAGPLCSSQGSKIKIGVFTDEECNIADTSKDVDDYLMDGDGNQMKLSHALLKTIYSDSCISCLAPQEEEENDDDNNYEEKEPETIELCEQLYDAAGKCESTHGFTSGYSYYGNQDANEDVVCDFIESIGAGSYDEYGEIVVNGASGGIGGGAKTTGGQKFALTFFILGTGGLAVYAGMLHSKLTKGGADGLTSSGGAMA